MTLMSIAKWFMNHFQWGVFYCQVYFAGRRLQVAGWNLIITEKPQALKRNMQVYTYRDCYMTLFTIAQKGGFPLSAKPAKAMGGEYIPMILSL